MMQLSVSPTTPYEKGFEGLQFVRPTVGVSSTVADLGGMDATPMSELESKVRILPASVVNAGCCSEPDDRTIESKTLEG